MKIYVAGKWSEREKVKKVMKALESKGHNITCDWTKHIAPERITQAHNKGCFTKDYDWSKNVDWAQNGHKTYAEEDLEGVSKEVFYKGAWIEVGIAIGLSKKIILVGEDITSVFLGLECITVVKCVKDAFEIIDSMNKDIINKDVGIGWEKRYG